MAALTAEQKESFINRIAPIVQACAKAGGYRVASPIIAQACLESRYGDSELAKSYHNYFGMKCGSAWKGKSVNMKTKEEYKVGTLATIRDNFRAYDSMEEGVKGYFGFISAKRYAALKTASTPRDYLERIKAAGYATSSSYVRSNMDMIARHGLTRFDAIVGTASSRDAGAGGKSAQEVAIEVIAGAWGNGMDRKNRLHAAGYDYAEVQSAVNAILRKQKNF